MPEANVSPVGQGMDDCDICHGVGLVGPDGTACVCVRMGGTRKHPPTAPRATSGMRMAIVLGGTRDEPIVVGMIDNLEGVQLDTLRNHIRTTWDAFKHANGDVNDMDFIEFLEDHHINVNDVAETVILE